MTARASPRRFAARLSAAPRSLRFKLCALGLGLAVLPLGMLAIALGYEQVLTAREVRRLRAAAELARSAGPRDLGALGSRLRVEIARLDAGGRVVERSDTAARALVHSRLGRLGERLVGGGEPESLAAADRALGPWAARQEVMGALGGHGAAVAKRVSPSAETVVIALAQPLPEGGALYLLSGTHRGVRRLMALRPELTELALYELALVLPLLLVVGLRVVRPIARLADAARSYPAVPLGDEKLLARGDEIAVLARTLSVMAADLEGRRQHAADLGADIAHELKSPLASIAASAELLGAGAALTRERIDLVSGTIERSVDRLRRSIDDLLALLRLEQAVPIERREPVAYLELVDELLGEYRRDPRFADWRFTLDAGTDAAAPLLSVPLNRRRWTELLRNLIDNALVQPAIRKEIVVAVRRVPEGLVTAVRDHGPGIPIENQRQVFRRFFSDRPPGCPPGSGLGLSVVEAIARAHGGRVDLRSSPGEGAVFSVTLPAPAGGRG
jgi:two-component system, OmpR family, sensor histidine kinase ChvG